MNRTVALFLLTTLSGVNLYSQEVSNSVMNLSDAPEDNSQKSTTFDGTYEEALSEWKSIEDINKWIGESFHYDIERAVNLGSKRTNSPKAHIMTPREFFLKKNGVCVDLSRFAYETAKEIGVQEGVHYLMIDFEPIEIKGSIIKKHWLIVFEREKEFYITADSKQPGVITGPYITIEEFIDEYEKLRNREIESFKLLDDYRKQKKKKLLKKELN